jgi:RNA recognition motif-containing protein
MTKKVKSFKRQLRLEDPKKKVLVENLNFKTTWQQLKDHMKEVGTVERADVVYNKTGLSKGFGYVK